MTMAGVASSRPDQASGPPIRVLVVCTGNSARSIMAEALLRSIGGDSFEVHSAGTHPKGVNPMALQVIGDAGLPTEGYASKPVDGFLGQPFDYVITVCDQAREACPVFPGAQQSLHWGYDDPAAVDGDEATRRAAFRRTFTAMAERIRTFVLLTLRQRREAVAGAQDLSGDPMLAARVGLIGTIPLFRGMPERTLTAICAVAEEVEYAPGASLTQEGEPGDTLIVITSGRATVARGGQTIRELAAGDFLGEVAVLDGGVRTATVLAAERIEALVIRRVDLLELIDTSPMVRLGIIEALARNLRRDAGGLA